MPALKSKHICEGLEIEEREYGYWMKFTSGKRIAAICYDPDSKNKKGIIQSTITEWIENQLKSIE